MGSVLDSTTLDSLPKVPVCVWSRTTHEERTQFKLTQLENQLKVSLLVPCLFLRSEFRGCYRVSVNVPQRSPVLESDSRLEPRCARLSVSPVYESFVGSPGR